MILVPIEELEAIVYRLNSINRELGFINDKFLRMELQSRLDECIEDIRYLYEPDSEYDTSQDGGFI